MTRTLQGRRFVTVLLLIFAMATQEAILLPRVSAELRAGACKVDITSDDAGPAHGRLHARALAVSNGAQTIVLVSMDVVAIGEIGPISNEFLPAIREGAAQIAGVDPSAIIINASHCHGRPAKDVQERTLAAIRGAVENMQPVTIGVGSGHEDRIQENRRLKLTSGRIVDVRHAYSMPRDEDVAEVGPIDPRIGILRVNRTDGRPLAVVYNFSCHPIQGVPSGANTADMTGFASDAIEEVLGGDAVALFVQGCGGDINPLYYKSVSMPRDAEPLGNMLAVSTLKAITKIQCRADDTLKFVQEELKLPRADLARRISELADERDRLIRSLRGTTLNIKTFVPLLVKQGLSAEFPSYYSHSYLHEDRLGRTRLRKLDEDNRRAVAAYLQNIELMEQLTRLQTNLKLLQKHQQHYAISGERTISVEVNAVRIGDLRLVTFPGELTVQIGLNLKRASPHPETLILGYTNGYIYYCPTAEQLQNAGYAQEDSDCLLAPEWQQIFESAALRLLEKL